jgi:hypothetical protein
MVAELVHEKTKGLALVFCMKVKGLDHFLVDEYEKASWFLILLIFPIPSQFQ